VVWFFLVRYGQDEVLTAFFLLAAWSLFTGRRPLAAAAVLAVGLLATKFTFGLFVVPFLVLAPHRLRFAAVFAALFALGALPFLAVHAPLWQPLVEESGALGTGPSLWRLPVVFTPLVLGPPAMAVLGAALAGVWGWGLRRRPPLDTLVFATGLVFLIVSPKAYPMYAAAFWPFACLWLARAGRPGDLVLAAVLNVLLGIWWYLDAGGIQGQFGPAVRLLAVVWTAAVPAAAACMVLRLIRSVQDSGGRESSKAVA